MNINLYFKFKTSSSNIFVLKIDIVFFTSKTLADILTELSDKVGGGGGGDGHPDPEIRGGGGFKKIFFRPFGHHFGLKIRGDRAHRAPPLDLPVTKMQKLLKMFTASLVIRVFLTFDLFDKTYKFAFFHKIFHDFFQFIHRTFSFSPFHNRAIYTRKNKTRLK